MKRAELTRRYVDQSGMRTEKINIDLRKLCNGDESQNLRLQDYDYFVVREIPELDLERSAVISGEVKFPGLYPIARGEKLSSLIQRAGGFTERAYLRGAVLTREKAKTVQENRMKELVKEIEESMFTNTYEAAEGALDKDDVESQKASYEAKKMLIDKLKGTEVSGRVVIRLATVDELMNSKYDIELEDGDKLVIPDTPRVVNIVGKVFNPTSLLYERGKKAGYYLKSVGGATEEADKKQISIVRADGTVISKSQTGWLYTIKDGGSQKLVMGGLMNVEMYPGDTIVVPMKIDKFFALKATKDLTTVIFHIALAAGVVAGL
jgi:protein involved in polysaccharide export with SLBB domain